MLTNKVVVMSCIEHVDSSKLDLILRNQTFVSTLIQSTPNFSILYKYFKLIDHNNNIKVDYFQYSRMIEDGTMKQFGRMFASNSLQNMPREIRATISSHWYFDLDIVNAQPTILQFLCSNYKIKTPCLDRYILHRNDIIQELIDLNSLPFNHVKKIILSVINGGLTNSIICSQWLLDFQNEITIIHNLFIQQFTNVFEFIKNTKSDNFSIKGAHLNYILCNYENTYLVEIIHFLKNKKIIDLDFVACFDGIMIPKNNVSDLSTLIHDIEVHLKNKYTINLCICHKEMIGIDLTYLPHNDDNIHVCFLKSSFSDGDVADYFCSIFLDQFKLFENVLYSFNGQFWTDSSSSIIYSKLDSLYFTLLQQLNDSFSDKVHLDFYNTVLNKKLIKLRTSRCLKGIWESIKFRIEVLSDIWDHDPYLLGFYNGTYDLKLGLFISPRKEDFISRVVPYDFKEVEQTEIDFAFDFINKVMPIPDERDFFLKSLATALDGKLLENIIFLLGNGRNGKDTITTNIMKAVLGPHLYYDAPNFILTDRIKTGANPEIANMHKKRLVVYSEPDKYSTLKCSTIKQLTGNEVMPIRGLYSSVNETRMHATQIVLQNSLLTMDSPDDAMLNRLFVIPFRSMFRTSERLAELPRGTPHAFIVNSYFKSYEFIERIKLPFMHILLKYYRIFYDEGKILKNAPKSISDASKQYISDSDDFVNWFNESYIITQDETDFIKLKDVYDKFKLSDLWTNMNKSERRKMTRAKLEKDIIQNPTLRAFFKDRKRIDGIDYKSIIVKHKIRQTNLINDTD